MVAYYNEIDPYCAQWLRNLIADNLIAPGDVDERDIRGIKPYELRPYTQCHFFAGIGGWSRALRLADVGDHIPLWTGSCPCQPFSVAGEQRGAADERHLWPHWFHLIAQCKPAVVLGEQVANAIGQGWLDLVFSDLEGEGYACGAAVLPACSVGAPHIRQRCWFVAHPGHKREGRSTGPDEAQGGRPFRDITGRSPWDDLQWLPSTDGKARPTQPGIFPLAHGISARMGKLRAAGNAIVPQVAAEFVKAAFR